MKELSIKEKAKSYDEAILRMRHAFDSNRCTIGFMNEIFPELKESEDEKIRKALIELVRDTTGDSLWIDYNVHVEDAIAWLEKQGEQKPVEWSKMDMERYESCLKQLGTGNPSQPETINSKWFREHCYAPFNCKKTVEWSDDDEQYLLVCKNALAKYQVSDKWDASIIYSWLKSLKDRYTWKPSDKQMKALHDLNLTGNLSYAGQGQVLIDLYNALKNLI